MQRMIRNVTMVLTLLHWTVKEVPPRSRRGRVVHWPDLVHSFPRMIIVRGRLRNRMMMNNTCVGKG